MSNRLIETMQQYGLKAELLGTDDNPSPEGQAIGDMLVRILSQEDEIARLRGKCNRLLEAVNELQGEPMSSRLFDRVFAHLSQDGDLTPEPHGAASEPTPDEGTHVAE